MPIYWPHLVLTKFFLDRDLPDADPDDKDRFAFTAACIPPPIGLMVPFIAESSLREPEPEPEPGEPDGDPKPGSVEDLQKMVVGLAETVGDLAKAVGDLSKRVDNLATTVDEIKTPSASTPKATPAGSSSRGS
jgi:hypothetical protein